MVKSSIIHKIKNIWKDEDSIFFVNEHKKISIKEILSKEEIISNRIKKGDIVALYGDFDPFTIKAFLHLIDLGAIILPITRDTKIYHKYYLKTCSVDYLIKNKKILKLNNTKRKNKFIKGLVKKKNLD
jgi:acyl-coenzyme A synthetase/AMP-(fatty) acid ligase